MTTKTKSSKTRQRHTQLYKTESLALVEKDGVPTAAKQHGLHESQLYSRRSKARLSQDRSVVKELLLVENARIKRSWPAGQGVSHRKIGSRALRHEPEVKHASRKKHSNEFKIVFTSRVLCASRSGFYRWGSEENNSQDNSNSAWFMTNWLPMTPMLLSPGQCWLVRPAWALTCTTMATLKIAILLQPA